MPLIHLLGYAGLIPFVGLTAMQFLPQAAGFNLPYAAFQSYSQIILAFMAGVLWPVLHQQSAKLFPLWVVSFALIAWFSSLLQPVPQLMVFAAAFALLRLMEIRLADSLSYSPAYQRLRNHLTTVVVTCQLVYAWSIS
jgi:hypothetical protein